MITFNNLASINNINTLFWCEVIVTNSNIYYYYFARINNQDILVGQDINLYASKTNLNSVFGPKILKDVAFNFIKRTKINLRPVNGQTNYFVYDIV